ncbi:hypothetical protein CDL15_Pgr019148 [Punica granatum]|uniref:Extensin-like n=1 Tax=Punica granatum TaxID=22663 RepID=A0A218X6J9_PUNGR|nr:hypothetical protein CDL15_Pgr019148 [Punica granatum]
MATNMAELLALLRGPNRASSSSTPPPGPGPTTDPTPWAPPTQAPENTEVPVPPTLHASAAHPFTNQFPPPPAPTAVPLLHATFPPRRTVYLSASSGPTLHPRPPQDSYRFERFVTNGTLASYSVCIHATFPSSEHILSAPPPVSIPAPAMAYTVPPPAMVFPASSAPAPTQLQATELPPYPSLQRHAGLSYQALPPINTTFHSQHPILAHRLPTRGLPTEARDTIHRPAIRGK